MRAALMACALLPFAALAAEPEPTARPAGGVARPARDPAADARALALYLGARAYPGAPPRYLHTDEGDFDAEPDACLSCHRRGTADAPVTPHPQLPECRHCHVRARPARTFRANTFAPLPPPLRGQRALPGAPPAMAHAPSALPANCLACHGEKGQLAALRTPHPERVACEQCHVSQRTRETWTPPGRLLQLARQKAGGSGPSAAQPGP